MLLKEAEAQAILNKYTEAFIALEEARHKKASEYGHWYTTKAGDEQRKKEAIEDAQNTADYWMQAYKDKMAEAQSVKIGFNIGGHTDPKSGGGRGGGKSGSDFDPKKAALETQKAIDDYKDKVKKYLKGANDEVNQLIIDSQEEGLVKELNVSRSATRRRLEDWEISSGSSQSRGKLCSKRYICSRKELLRSVGLNLMQERNLSSNT